MSDMAQIWLSEFKAHLLLFAVTYSWNVTQPAHNTHTHTFYSVSCSILQLYVKKRVPRSSLCISVHLRTRSPHYCPCMLMRALMHVWMYGCSGWLVSGEQRFRWWGMVMRVQSGGGRLGGWCWQGPVGAITAFWALATCSGSQVKNNVNPARQIRNSSSGFPAVSHTITTLCWTHSGAGSLLWNDIWWTNRISKSQPVHWSTQKFNLSQRKSEN